MPSLLQAEFRSPGPVSAVCGGYEDETTEYDSATDLGAGFVPNIHVDRVRRRDTCANTRAASDRRSHARRHRGFRSGDDRARRDRHSRGDERCGYNARCRSYCYARCLACCDGLPRRRVGNPRRDAACDQLSADRER